MNNKGSALLIIALAVIILLMAGAALFVTGRRSASGGPPPGGAPKVGFAVSCARTPGGVAATLTVSNKGGKGLDEFRMDLVAVPGMKPGRALPFMIGKLPAGGSSVVTIPFTGTAPAVNAPVQIELHYDYREGWFTRGAGNTSITTVVP